MNQKAKKSGQFKIFPLILIFGHERPWISIRNPESGIRNPDPESIKINPESGSGSALRLMRIRNTEKTEFSK